MKKILPIIFFILISGYIFGQNTMYVRDTSAQACDTVFLEIWVENSDAFNAFQFDIEFSENVFFCISDSSKLSSRSQGHVLVTSFPETNKLRVFAYSMSQNLFNGNSGAIVKLCFVALPNQTGDFPFFLSNAILSGEELNNILNETINGKIRLLKECSININAGWTWFSLNLTDQNMLTNKVLSSLSPQNDDYIKNQTASATYYENIGWFGDLDEINNTDMYKIHLENPDVITFSGMPSDLFNTSINIFSGWNWIGYIPNEIITIETALSSLNILPFDYIKDQTNSSTYYENFGWFGELSEFLPLNGYMLKVAESGTLTYPDTGPESKSMIAQNKKPEFLSTLNFSPNAFEYNGSITAEVILDGNNSGSENNILFAFVENQCRGKVVGKLFPPTGKYVYNLMMHSNTKADEEIIFKFFDNGENQWYEFKETLKFEADIIEADAYNPFELKNGSVIDPDWIIDKKFSFEVYPNPFNGILIISFINPENQNVNIAIYDGYGRKVDVIEEKTYQTGEYIIEWNGERLPKGIYFIRMETNSYVGNQKVVKAN